MDHCSIEIPRMGDSCRADFLEGILLSLNNAEANREVQTKHQDLPEKTVQRRLFRDYLRRECLSPIAWGGNRGSTIFPNSVPFVENPLVKPRNCQEMKTQSTHAQKGFSLYHWPVRIMIAEAESWEGERSSLKSHELVPTLRKAMG